MEKAKEYPLNVVVRWVGGNLHHAYWSQNTTRLDFPNNVPERHQGHASYLYGIKPNEIDHPQYYARHRYHWPMIAGRLNYSSPFLVKFDFTFHTLPVLRRSDGLYELDPRLSERWRDQEALCLILGGMLSSVTYLSPLTQDPIVWPSNHKYFLAHSKERTVRWRCLQAIMRFREHWGLLAYYALGIKGGWRKHLEKQAMEAPHLDVTKEWLDSLESSGIFDQSSLARRAGVFVHVPDLEVIGRIQRYLQSSVPVWVLFAQFRLDDVGNVAEYVVTYGEKLARTYFPYHPPMHRLLDEVRDVFYILLQVSRPVDVVMNTADDDYQDVMMEGEFTEPSLISLPTRSAPTFSIYNPSFLATSGVAGIEPSAYTQSPRTSPNAFSNADLDSPLSPRILISSPIAVDYVHIPLPLHDSGQGYGQTWVDFFRERDWASRELELNEKTEESQKRWAVLRHAEEVLRSSLPLSSMPSGFRLFDWVDSEVPGFYLRHPVPEDEWDEIWLKYPPSRRTYDYHTNEFDLFTLLDPSYGEETGDASSENTPMLVDEQETYPHSAVPLTNYTAERGDFFDLGIENERNGMEEDDSVKPAGSYVVQKVSDSDIPAVEEAVTNQESMFPNTFNHAPDETEDRVTLLQGHEWLVWRFGCRLTSRSTSRVALNQHRWRKALGVGTSYELSPDDISQSGNYEHVADMLASENPSIHLFPEYLDIFPTHPHYLSPREATLGVERLELTKGRVKRHVYRLYPKNESSERAYPWFIAVDEATTVVIAIRNGWGDTRDSLTRNFMEFGFPFHTFKVREVTKASNPARFPAMKSGLTVPPTELAYSDYALFETEREVFFSSERGRALARCGGNIRRYYRAKVGEREGRLRRVIEGPTELASLLGDAYSCFINGQATTVYEDRLTPEEEDFLCGSYATEKTIYDRGKGPAEKISWTRPLSVDRKIHFLNNGGIWNPIDEKNYMSRRRDILQRGKPDNMSFWSKFKEQNLARKVEEGYERLAIQYIQEFVDVSPYYGDFSSSPDLDGFISRRRFSRSLGR